MIRLCRWSQSAAFVASMAALGLVVGCTAPKPAAENKEPPEVLVSPPAVAEVIDYEDFTGRVEALKTVEVRTRVTGYLEKFLFEEGRDVKEGEILFQIDARPYRAALDQAVAEVDQAQAQQAKADADYQRARGSFSKNAISRSDYDLASATFAEAKAAIAVADAKRETAQLNFAWTKVTAPISGQASRRMVDPGNLVQADLTLLTTLVFTEKVYINFDIDGVGRGDRVIVSGSQRVRPKMIVKPKTLDEFAKESQARRDHLAKPKDGATAKAPVSTANPGGRP